jgi:hypothetical protein
MVVFKVIDSAADNIKQKGAPGSSVGKGTAVLSWGWGFESHFIPWI